MRIRSSFEENETKIAQGGRSFFRRVRPTASQPYFLFSIVVASYHCRSLGVRTISPEGDLDPANFKKLYEWTNNEGAVTLSSLDIVCE